MICGVTAFANVSYQRPRNLGGALCIARARREMKGR
jgi:hypothetical protein